MPHSRRLLGTAVLAFAWISTPGNPVSQGLHPLATAVTDFDRDGREDLAVLYEGEIHVLATDPDAGGFRAERKVAALGFPANRMAAGDFDGDGTTDLVLAERGSATLTTLLGDGEGRFGQASVTLLSGELTALMAADVNRRDGLLDWVAAVVDAQGPALLVFEGAEGPRTSVPERIALPAPATALAAGRFEGSHLADLAAACGGKLVLVAGRDRRLHTPDARVPEPVATSFALEREAAALLPLANERQLAILDAEGGLHVWRDGAVVAADASTKQALLVHGKRLLAANPGLSGRTGLLERGGEIAVLPLDADGFDDLVTIDARDGAVTVVPSATTATFVVNSTADTTDASAGNGVCDDGTGACTLRAALQEANASAGADTITFALGAGTPTIAPASPLPLVTGVVSIQGNTGGATRVQLNGAGAGFPTSGLTFSAGSSGSLVRSLVINRFVGWGIRLDSADNTVEDCWIGLDASGSPTVQGNASGGIHVFGAQATGNLIGGSAAGTRNVIARSSGPGLRIESSASGNRVRGNYIGTNPGANVAAPNGLDGVHLLSAGAGNRIEANVISGNTGNGLVIEGATATGTLVEGNLIGTHGSGLTVMGNGQNGILITGGAASNTIGGTTPAQRNVVSGHGSSGSDGIELNGTGVTSTNIFGNIIGLDAAGTNAFSNGQDGILITAGATSNTVGAATATPGTAGGNVISGNNRHGVRIDSTASGTLLQGNVIGLRADGATAQRNVGSGISTAAADTTVGGATASQRNVVSGGNTIVLAAGAHNAAVKGNFLGTDVNGTVKVVDGGVSASDVTTTGITGLVIGGLSASPGAPPGNVVAGGIALTGQGVHDAVVQGNIVGLDVTGTAVLGGTGITVSNRSKNNLIGGTTASARNVLSGNTNGVTIQGFEASGNLVQGNYIGTDITGTIARGNGSGVVVLSGSSGTVIGGSTGTPGTPPGNLISGNSAYGVSIDGVGNAGQVRGNILGAKADGLSALPNQTAGIYLGGSTAGTTVGGSSATDRNLISGNAASATTTGVTCQGCTATNFLRGNWIGVDITGTAPLPNGVGVSMSGVLVTGGTNAGEGNVISGNLGVGILTGSGGGSILGNLIGVAPDGVGAMGNGSHGISTSGTIGPIVGGLTGITAGACTGACNTIRFNAGSGIHLPAENGRQQIVANRIADNGGLGIDLAGSGPTPNDPGDTTLPQNSPVITIVHRAGNTSIQGTVTGAPSTSVSVDVFGSATADPSSYGEGDVWLGTAFVNLDTSGNGSWVVFVPSAPAVLTAVAITSGRGSSEFALNFLDADNDGFADGFDVCPQVANPDQIDDDVDGHGNVCDCAPSDPGAFAAVSEVSGPTLGADKQTVSWVSQVAATGSGTVHQLLRGALGQFPVGSGASEVCLSTSSAASFVDASTPVPGAGYWYLVRATNACGAGTYGTASGGSPRVSSTCP